MTLGQKLKQTRLARGMTQSQVVGDRITRNMLSQIENDLASPSVGTLEYLASVLNVRLSWLLADEQEEAEAGRTQRLRELLKSGEYAACLELAPEHAPDDEQALALAMAAAQCAQRALESERFDTARHLAQRPATGRCGCAASPAAGCAAPCGRQKPKAQRRSAHGRAGLAPGCAAFAWVRAGSPAWR